MLWSRFCGRRSSFLFQAMRSFGLCDAESESHFVSAHFLVHWLVDNGVQSYHGMFLSGTGIARGSFARGLPIRILGKWKEGIINGWAVCLCADPAGYSFVHVVSWWVEKRKKMVNNSFQVGARYQSCTCVAGATHKKTSMLSIFVCSPIYICTHLF